MPTVACMTRSICSSRLAHWRVMAFFSRSRSSFMVENASTIALNSLAEARAGEIAVDHFHLGLLAFAGLAGGGDFDQALAQG